MALNPATFILEDRLADSMYLYRTIAGQPAVIVPLLAVALSVGRRNVNPHEFAARICAAAYRTPRTFAVFGTPAPTRFPHRYRYLIEFDKPHPLFIHVVEISDAGNESVLYEGRLENYLTKELRKPRKQRGRTPAGFSDRTEFEAHVDTVRKDEHPLAYSTLEEDVLAEREQTNTTDPKLDLTGVIVHSKADALKRIALARKARRTGRKNKAVSRSSSDD